MAMSSAGSPNVDLNVTPLIDVLLVLLIIFMVIMPSLSTGLPARVAQTANATPAAPRDDIVITALGNDTVLVNRETVALADLGLRLKTILKNAANHVIFVSGAKDLDYAYIAQVIDIARGAGLDQVALMRQ